MRPISLHHQCIVDASASELVEIAADLGCDHVCLFVQGRAGRHSLPIVTDAEAAELKLRMDDRGISAHGLASFQLAPDFDPAAYEPALARGASLGGSRASMVITDPEEGRAIDNFGRFCRLAASYGVTAGIEFGGFGVREALDQAVRIVKAADAGGTITVDALHVVRTGVAVADLAALDPALLGFLQVCDGPLQGTAENYSKEGRFDRLPPGEGEYPLLDILALFPPARTASLEVPQERLRLQGVSPRDRARRVVEAGRRLFATEAH